MRQEVSPIDQQIAGATCSLLTLLNKRHNWHYNCRFGLKLYYFRRGKTRVYERTVLSRLEDYRSTELRSERIHRYEVDTEYKLRERARVVSEERRRNRAPGFLRGLAPIGCALDTVQTRHAPQLL